MKYTLTTPYMTDWMMDKKFKMMVIKADVSNTI